MPDPLNETGLMPVPEEVVRYENQGRRNLDLRRQLRQSQLIADRIFTALCEDDRSAEWAMGELWGSGAFDCGPQDYEAIVHRCLAALKQVDSERRITSL